MSTINVFTKDGKEKEQITLNDAIFGARVNKRLLDDVVRLYGNNKRTGNSSTKTFGEVRGGGKKPWKQKGTGRARTSSIRNPIWRGGGIVFGPRPRDIYFSIPQKMRQKAIISALSQKFKDADIIVVDDFGLTAPKTKEMATMVKSLDIASKSVLCLVSEKGEKVARASQNLPRFSLKTVDEFNAYHVMRKKKILVEKQAIEKLEERLKDIL